MGERTSAVVGRERAALLAIALLGAGLRLAWLDGQPLWFDEAFSRWLAQQGPAALVGWVARIDQHPPLYYLLLAGWVQVAGSGLAAIRLFSCLVSIPAILLVGMAARRLVGREVGWTAALVMALAPFQIHYAQEARMYALLNLAVAGAVYALARLLAPDAGERTLMRWWGLLVGAQAAALWTHNTAILLVGAALNAGVVAAWALNRGAARLPGLDRPGFWLHWGLAQAAVLALWLPWSPAFLAQVRAVDADFWIAAPTGRRVWEGVNTLIVAHVPGWWPQAANWAVLGIGLAAVGAVRLGLTSPRTWLLGTLWVGPLLLELAVSLRRPIFHEHTLIWTGIPFALLAAAGTRPPRSGLGSSVWRLGAAALLLAYPAPGIYGYFAEFHKEPWDAATAFVAARAQPGDLVIFHATWAQLPFDYYYPPDAPAVARLGVPSHLFDSGAIEPKFTRGDLPMLAASLKGHERVWLVYTHWWYTDPEGLLPAALERFGRVVDRAEWMGIEVRLVAAE